MFTLEILLFCLLFVVYTYIYPDFDLMPLTLLTLHFFSLWGFKFWPFISLTDDIWSKFVIALNLILLSALELAVPCVF